VSSSAPERGRTPVAFLWGRLTPGTPPADALCAFTGLSHPVARQVVGTTVAGSPEAGDLLERMPATVRSLAISTTVSTERCYGEIRGPVMWSETISARSATAGDPGLFVCAVPAKAYDTPENRVLVAALAAVVAAGREAAASGEDPHDPAFVATVRRAVANGGRARRWLEHRALETVPRDRLDGREMRRTRTGNRRRVYRPAVRLLEVARRPVDPDLISRRIDASTLADLARVTAAIELLERSGRPCGAIEADHGQLRCGPVRYRPAGAGGDAEIDLAGVDGPAHRRPPPADTRPTPGGDAT
jgi:hypothetical protein